jgi:hypothetical protein
MHRVRTIWSTKLNRLKGGVIPDKVQIRLTSSVDTILASLEPYAGWIEQILGVPLSETLTLEMDCNPADAVAEELLQGIDVVSATRARNSNWRKVIDGWEIPPGVSPPFNASENLAPLRCLYGNSTGKTVRSPSSCGVWRGEWLV